MDFIWGLIVGIIISAIVCLVWLKIRKPVNEIDETNFNPNVAIKQENIAKLENLISQKQAGDKITNDEVQKLFKVSDATAERYLQELEQKRLLKQEGETGHTVFYLKI
jgi:Fic family protein